MSSRTIIIICAVFATIFVFVCSGVGLLFYRFVTQFPVGRSPQLGPPAVVMGEGFLQKRLFVDNQATGPVTDILVRETPAPTIGVAGLRGALWVSPEGQVTSSVAIPSSATHVDILDVDVDGDFEFLNRGGSGWQPASLIDSSGNVLWTCSRGSGVNDMAAGDLDGDGVAEFVVGYNGGDGVHALDRNGRRKWQQPDGNVWHVEIVDTDADGAPEIVHSNAGGQITVRDTAGRVLSRAQPGPYCSDFSLCRWPTKNGPQRLLLAEDDQIWLFDFDGTTVKRFHAPDSAKLGAARGTPVRLAADQPPYLAVLVAFDNWDRAILYVYDSDGALVYQEVIGETCASLAAVPRDDAGIEVLLIGGNGKVWEYALPQ